MKQLKKSLAAMLAVLTLVCCVSLCLCAFAEGETDHVHDYKPVTVVAPTCTNPGLTRYICDCGDVDETRDTVIPATGHNWGYWTTIKEATEEEEGLKERTCLNDPTHKDYKKIAKLEPDAISGFLQKIIARIKAFFAKIMDFLYRD